MSPYLSEADLEAATLEWFRELGYEVQEASAVAPESLASERHSHQDVVLEGRLRQALLHLNPDVPDEAIDEAVRRVSRRDAPSLTLNNEAFHRLLCEGVAVEVAQEGQVRGKHLRLFDFTSPDDNDFLVLNQFDVVDTASGTGHARRLDVVVFVNGLPLAVLELKNPEAEEADVWTGYDQLQTYKRDLPSLFAYNEVLVSSDDVEARLGSLTSPRSRFMRWRTIDGDDVAPAGSQPLEVLVKGVFERGRFLDLVRHFVVFEAERGRLIKKLAGYHQFHAVRTATAETRRAIGPEGDRKIGVVWHTQGSGKSLTMLFFCGKLVVDPALENPTIVVLTDRNDLDDQLFSTFSSGQALLRQKPVQAKDRRHLRELLETTSGGVYFTTIQKFLPVEGETYPALSERRNIVVVADEAHRSQYGLRAKVRQATGELTYGYAKHMRDALPNASFIGFTGTPIEKEDADTRKVFGDHIDIYDIQRAVEDEATVPILYESRLAQLELDEHLRASIDPEFEEVTEGQELEAREALKTKWAAMEKIVGDEGRLAVVAADIVEHFEQRNEAMAGKALIVCMSRRICAALYDEICKLRPAWHDTDPDGGGIKVVMSGSASDPAEMQPHFLSKSGKERMAERFKDPKDPLKLVIVRDMWLTGFDVPCLHTMYVDKPMRGHNLMQAIARVNRVFGDKPGGLIVDYIGIAAFLKEAMKTYTESGGQGSATQSQDEAVEAMVERLEMCRDLMHGFDYSHFETASPAERLKLLPAAREHVLSLRDESRQDSGYDRFMRTVAELSKAFALAMPHPTAEDARVEVAFFQAVRAGLSKLEAGPGKKRGPDVDAAIRQIVSGALVAGEVVDVFEAAGIDRPDISILSEEFLAEVQAMQHKNLAAAMLERLLRGEIRQRKKYSVVQERSFADLLDNALAKYKNRAIDSAEMIGHLLEMARQIRDAHEQGKKLGLTQEEFYFYEALGQNQSAKEVMGDKALAKVASELTRIVRENATIDWTRKKNVQANLRRLVKRQLKKSGYPPDEQKAAAELILEQAKRFAGHVSAAPTGESFGGGWIDDDEAPDSIGPPSNAPPARPLPYPIAVFDGLIESQASLALRFRNRLDGFERAMAFLVGAELGLLRARRGDLSGADIKKILGKDLGKPLGMGTWVHYAYAFAKLIDPEDNHPVAVAARALLDAKGKRSELLTRIQDEVVPLRNTHAHTTTRSEEALAAKEKPLAEVWHRLKKAMSPFRQLRLASRTEFLKLEADQTYRFKVRLHEGGNIYSPIREVVVDTALEEEWCYLIDDDGRCLSMLPILTCIFDEKAERPTLFIARSLGMNPGDKYELQSMATSTKVKRKI